MTENPEIGDHRASNASFVTLRLVIQGTQPIKGKHYKKKGNYSRGLGVDNLQNKKGESKLSSWYYDRLLKFNVHKGGTVQITGKSHATIGR